MSAGSNFQFGIRKVGSFTFNIKSLVTKQREWTNRGNSSYDESGRDDSDERVISEFGLDVGWGLNYKNIHDVRGGDLILNDNSELSLSFMGVTSKLSWGDSGKSIFYGGNIGVGGAFFYGGNAETWYGNVIKF